MVLNQVFVCVWESNWILLFAKKRMVLWWWKDQSILYKLLWANNKLPQLTGSKSVGNFMVPKVWSPSIVTFGVLQNAKPLWNFVIHYLPSLCLETWSVNALTGVSWWRVVDGQRRQYPPAMKGANAWFKNTSENHPKNTPDSVSSASIGGVYLQTRRRWKGRIHAQEGRGTRAK